VDVEEQVKIERRQDSANLAGHSAAALCENMHFSWNWKRIYSVVHNDSRWPPGTVAAFFVISLQGVGLVRKKVGERLKLKLVRRIQTSFPNM